MNASVKREAYDSLIEDLRRESELSTCSSCQRQTNLHRIHLLNTLKNTRTSGSYSNDLGLESMAKRTVDPNYRFSPWGLLDE